MKFENIAVPLGVGVVFSLPSVLINNTRYWILFPWTYPGRALLNGSNLNFPFSNYMYIISVAVFVIFIIVGVYEFNKKIYDFYKLIFSFMLYKLLFFTIIIKTTAKG